MQKYYVIITIVYLILSVSLISKMDFNKTEEVNHYTTELPEPIIITLDGAVVYSGQYTYYSPVYLDEVIKAAGGLLDDANYLDVNFNELISKSKHVNIKTKTISEDANNYFEKIDLNKVSFKELLLIPNVTENRAANIIIYRNQNGIFNSVEELINVKGIGSATFEKIKDHFKVL